MATPRRPSISQVVETIRRQSVGVMTLREQPARFDGDRPRYYAVIKIADVNRIAENQRHSLLKKFEQYDFELLSHEEDGRAIFSTKPTASPPPVDAMLALLVFRIAPDKSWDRHIDAMTARPEPEDNPGTMDVAALDRIPALAGKRRQPAAPTPDQLAAAAGRRPLRVTFDGRFFVANVLKGDLPRETVMRAAGWLPYLSLRDGTDRAKVQALVSTGAWAVRDPILASPFKFMMDDRARAELESATVDAKRRIALSKSAGLEFEGVDLPRPEGLDYLAYQRVAPILAKEAMEAGRPGEPLMLADDMGLGKTIQAIGVANVMAERILDRPLRILVVCPQTARVNWRREFEKWFIASDRHSIGVAEGNSFPDTDVTIINHDITARHSDRLRAAEWDLIVTDEAHMILNRDAQRTIAILGDGDQTIGMAPLAKNGIFLPMTGTPLPNKVRSMFTLLSAYNPDMWGRGETARQIFTERYCAPRVFQVDRPTKGGGPPKKTTIVNEDGAARLAELNLRLRAGGMVRRLKSDKRILANLPPKRRRLVELPMQISQDAWAMLSQAKLEIDALAQAIDSIATPGSQADLAFTLSTEGMQAFRDMARLPDGQPIDFMALSRTLRNLAIVKAPAVAAYLCDLLEASAESPEPEKLVCFGHHSEALSAIAQAVEKRFPKQSALHIGSTSKGKRQKAIDDFQQGDQVRLFIGSYGSASTAITLTRSHRVIGAELVYDPAQVLQSEDRVWRIGQQNAVLSEFTVLSDTPEMKIAKVLLRKLEQIGQAIDGNPKIGLSFEEVCARLFRNSDRMVPDAPLLESA